MRFASLGSGSRGNALVVEAEVDGRTTRVLLDCGFGPRELAGRLARLGLSAGEFDALVLTHEHSDHCAGAAACARRFGLAVHLTHGTLAALGGEMPAARLIIGDVPFFVGDIEITPFPVPHDAREPVQFVFRHNQRKLGVLTDAGSATPHLRSHLDGCDALVIECNHDEKMLMTGSYPWLLKRRIAGAYGHLANTAAAALLSSLDRSRLQFVVAAHLSEQNNRPEIAHAVLAEVAGNSHPIVVANQDAGFAWLTLE